MMAGSFTIRQSKTILARITFCHCRVESKETESAPREVLGDHRRQSQESGFEFVDKRGTVVRVERDGSGQLTGAVATKV